MPKINIISQVDFKILTTFTSKKHTDITTICEAESENGPVVARVKCSRDRKNEALPLQAKVAVVVI